MLLLPFDSSVSWQRHKNGQPENSLLKKSLSEKSSVYVDN